MNTHTKPCFSMRITAIFLAAALSCPGIALSVSIGEIVAQSKLGEPLSIYVRLGSSPGEDIETSCISLLASDPGEEDAQDYLVSARLAVKNEVGQQFIAISSHKPFNEAFVKIRLQVNCRGQGSVTKTLTFLPDFEPASPGQIVVPGVAVETGNSNISLLSIGEQPSPDIALSPSQDSIPGASPGQAQSAAVSSFAAPKQIRSSKSGKGQQSTFARTPRKKRGHEVFMFKLSSEPIDESRIGKISAEEREILLARQKFLDADDQMANFLAMQHQIKQLQDELGEIKLKLSQLGAGSPLSELPVASEVGISPPASSAKDGKVGYFAGGMALAILALLLGFRYYNRVHSQRLGEKAWTSAVIETTPPIVTPPPTRPAPTNIDTGDIRKTPRAAPAHTPKNGGIPPSATSALLSKSQEELSEVDSIIEEAELYSTYGHPDRAVLMLQELIQQHPTKIDAWELLLLILSSQKKVAEFAQAAGEFMLLNKNSAAWKKIQAMGRSLDRHNPLYADDNTPIPAEITPPQVASGKRRLIGNILVEMGALTALDMAFHLDDFDPKRDGRIGEYLVSRKAITNEQLVDALRLQQGSAAPVSTQQSAGTPEIHTVDDFIPDVDPKIDNRLDEYMKMDMSRSNKPKKP